MRLLLLRLLASGRLGRAAGCPRSNAMTDRRIGCFGSFCGRTQNASPPLNLYILSAKYGLISGDILIPDYDLRMTSERAAKLKPAVKRRLDLIFGVYQCDEIFIAMGKVYREALMDFLPSDGRVVVAEGRIG